MGPTADAREALQRLRRSREELVRLAEQLDITLIVAFGSAVTSVGTAADVDLAVAGDRPLDVLALMEALYQLTGYERFDVLDLRRADVVARVQALQRGETLVERRRGEHNEQLVQALALYWDTQWLRDLELETLAR